MKNFQNKVVVITGAGSGIGRSTAMAFAKHGAKLHITDIKQDRIESVANEIQALDAEAIPYVVDSSDKKAMEKFANDVFAASGRVDILHNNAGIAVGFLTEKTTLEEWERIINVNLWGVIYGVHYFLPRMIEQDGEAHIVNTSSGAGLTSPPTLAAYSTSKAAVLGLSEVMNIELQRHGIYTTALCPGIINTTLVKETKMDLHDKDGKNLRDRIINLYETRGVSPDRVAEDVLKAIRKKRPVQPSPYSHIFFMWIMKRISVRLYHAFMRKMMTRLE